MRPTNLQNTRGNPATIQHAVGMPQVWGPFLVELGARFRVIGHDDFLARGVEHGAA